MFMVHYEPPAGPRMERVQRQIFTHPPEWIITHRDRTYTGLVDEIIPYLGIKDFILNNYLPVSFVGGYAVLKRKA